MQKRRLKDTSKAPHGGWVISPTINGVVYRIPEGGYGNSFIHLKAALRAQSANAGKPLTDTEAADIVHDEICRRPLSDCITIDDNKEEEVPFEKRTLPVGTVALGTGGGCGACGGRRRR